MFDDRRVGKAREGSAEVFGQFGVRHGQPAYVGFVDDGVRPGNLGESIGAPVEGVVHHDTTWDHSRAI